MTKEQAGSNFVFAVSKNGRRDDNLVADDEVDKMTACINLWIDVFNDNAPATI